jgi:hypothetical protein
MEVAVDEPFLGRGRVRQTRMLELKIQNQGWYRLVPQVLGSNILTNFHDNYVHRVWLHSCLLFLEPHPGLPPSVTFLMPQDGCVKLHGHRLSGIRIQGESDQETSRSVRSKDRKVSATTALP